MDIIFIDEFDPTDDIMKDIERIIPYHKNKDGMKRLNIYIQIIL